MKKKAGNRCFVPVARFVVVGYYVLLLLYRPVGFSCYNVNIHKIIIFLVLCYNYSTFHFFCQCQLDTIFHIFVCIQQRCFNIGF